MFPRIGWHRFVALSLGGASLLLTACDNDPAGPDEPDVNVTFSNHSVTPQLVKNLPAGVTTYSLISSDDVLAGSPNFVFGGSADGAGLLRNADGTFTLLMNHEDNYSVSRIKLDGTFKPISGEYILTSDNGRWRLCSATLATVAEHGFSAFLTVGESSIESMIHAVDPLGAPNTSRLLSALGKWNSENAVPLPLTAYAGRTAILIGDDDSGVNGGQLAMYLSSTVGDLENGNLYALARTDGNMRERDMVVGQVYPVQFKQIANQKTLTGAQVDAASATLGAIKFGRTEDIDYRRGVNSGREVYFNTTGQANTGVNADNSRSKYGRVYRLMLDTADPLKGTLELVMDGDNRPGTTPVSAFQNVDNILVTQNYVYAQEDPNGYGDETHDARIYQYNIATKEVKIVMELDHRRGEPAFNVGGSSTFGSWEYGAMIDVSETLGEENTFLLALQPHTWRADRYKGVDGGTLRATENQGSAVIVVRGLPR